MNPIIRYEEDITELRKIAQTLLDLLVKADAAQVAEGERSYGKNGSTDLPEGSAYWRAALSAPEWIRDELDWSNSSDSLFLG